MEKTEIQERIEKLVTKGFEIDNIWKTCQEAEKNVKSMNEKSREVNTETTETKQRFGYFESKPLKEDYTASDIHESIEELQWHLGCMEYKTGTISKKNKKYMEQESLIRWGFCELAMDF